MEVPTGTAREGLRAPQRWWPCRAGGRGRGTHCLQGDMGMSEGSGGPDWGSGALYGRGDPGDSLERPAGLERSLCHRPASLRTAWGKGHRGYRGARWQGRLLLVPTPWASWWPTLWSPTPTTHLCPGGTSSLTPDPADVKCLSLSAPCIPQGDPQKQPPVALPLVDYSAAPVEGHLPKVWGTQVPQTPHSSAAGGSPTPTWTQTNPLAHCQP